MRYFITAYRELKREGGRGVGGGGGGRGGVRKEKKKKKLIYPKEREV